ncbi:MAG: hypothetical protein U0174_28645 [Polyangiaceae bacterium]
MSKGLLTRQELGWLLTQEAQGAAERLRLGVNVLRTSMPPPMHPRAPGTGLAGVDAGSGIGGLPEDARHLDATLDALDDAMRLLTSLHQQTGRGTTTRTRRGRIDLAALLWELAPDARVAIEPGHGTEVYGEEEELRRMMQVFLGPGLGAGCQVSVRREGDDVRVVLALGPEGQTASDTERAWLSRMALRFAGRYELDGGVAMLAFPAEGAVEVREKDALRKELDEAKKQGEAYARELAALVEQREEHSSSFPAPIMGERTDAFALVAMISRGIAAELRTMVAPVAQELDGLKIGKADDEAHLESARRRLASVQDWMTALSWVGELDPQELPSTFGIAQAARRAAERVAFRAARGHVKVTVKPSPEEDTDVDVRSPPRAVEALVRLLVAQAVASSPRDGAVTVTAEAETKELGARLYIDDQGAPVPSSAHREFLGFGVDAGAYGRPSALPYVLAGRISQGIGVNLDLADSPQGGLRVILTFAKVSV